MGKKTSKFIAAIEDLQKQCKTQMEGYIKTGEESVRLEPLADQLVAACIKRFNDLLVANGKDRERARQAICVDPEYLEHEKQSDALGLRLTKLKKERSQAKDGIFNALAKMTPKLDEFEKYIAKKEKSKNPFKSKKSVPAAKDFIAASRLFHEHWSEYLKSIGGIDMYY
jgi:hypothetical protein